ncbi:hypothetical protein [Aureimonas phyllosphaerae]|uniref:Uncharacterized protein n=1 Tax=Aureimonas phyllosphaerae TaxID=1166078 RepID=A0A7W6FUC8_9HYPH|nr:hypothetical protein [Aureimonas phyllosphaerae]MBB3935956.1 hypothetical protein [Aureimonas phyllosphaerae]MBB3960319.1 hypothetical protein [Aureimonas phyllosphaerae]
MIWVRQEESMAGRGEQLSGSIGSVGFEGAAMMIGYKLGANGLEPLSGDATLAGTDPTGETQSSRQVDERTAVYLLSLARELLRRDHSAIAGMIDYAIAEIESGPEQ